MCTVSYLPVGTSDFYLTSNRDEAPYRASQKIVKQRLDNGASLFFPQDPQSGGTWIALSNRGRLLCLLNGAYEQHQRALPYRRSRGLVVLDAFAYNDLQAFFTKYDFKGIEPFTLISMEGKTLLEFRWDGEKRYKKELDGRQPYIWSSVTLYDKAYQKKREQLFQQFLARTPAPELTDILHFHQSDGTGDADNDFVMNRDNIVRTVSITSILATTARFKLYHKDLLKDHLEEVLIPLEPAGIKK